MIGNVQMGMLGTQVPVPMSQVPQKAVSIPIKKGESPVFS